MLLFAHRGGRAHAPENTLAAFRGALARGATGLESDVRLSADGVPVLVHDPALGPPWARRRVSATPRDRLPPGVLSLADLYAAFGAAFDLSLDVKDPAAAPSVVALARAAGAAGRLWLCGPAAALAAWRALDPLVRLVDSTRLRDVDEGICGRAARLRGLGAQALNLPGREWTAERVAAVHTEGVLAFGWDAHTLTAVRRLRALSCDGIYGDDVDALLRG